MKLTTPPLFGSYILETLTVGMYGESRNAIREYIQNAFDSIQTAIHEKVLRQGAGKIEIEMSADRNSLTIRDNGAGIYAKSAESVLTSIGASGKNHEKDAGFRGIGRLSGISFSDTVRFRTKAAGESTITVVTYNGKDMRRLMKPGSDGPVGAAELLQQCIDVGTEESEDRASHFFEVVLEGWDDEPPECTSAVALREFVRQVAPVPFDPGFRQREVLLASARAHKMHIEEVAITLQDGDGDPALITKPYRDQHYADKNRLADVTYTPIDSTSPNWWGWVGHKQVPSNYVDAAITGVRIRVKNIQIDGKELFADIFRTPNNRTADRFQEYFLGEIHIRPGHLVPNARRDGFEEDKNWKALKRELRAVATKLKEEAQKVSASEQLSLDSLTVDVTARQTDLAKLRRSGFGDRDAIQKLMVSVTDVRERIAKAVLEADSEVRAKLGVLADRCGDMKTELAGRLEAPAHDCRDEIEAARASHLTEVLMILKKELRTEAYLEASRAIERHYED